MRDMRDTDQTGSTSFPLIPSPSRRQCLVGAAGVALGLAVPSAAEVRAERTGDRLVLTNGVVARTIRLPTTVRPTIATVDFRTVAQPSRYFTGHDGGFVAEHAEFAFLADGRRHSGSSGWTLQSLTDATDAHGGRGTALALRSSDGAIGVELRYLLYPGLPVVRKSLTVTNLGAAPVRLENIDVESFAMELYWPGTTSWVYSDYGRRKSLIPFVGGRQDALVALHNPDWGEGVVLGNEAAGVNKYIDAFVEGATFRAGVARRDSAYPWARWVVPGASVAAPRTFSLVYADTPRFETILNTAVPDFVRRHMGIRLAQLPVKPSFVYNTWQPFQKNIDETLLTGLATAAAAAGIREFVVDDGWQSSYGDWTVDPVKFPNGLKPVMDHIKALGMKPGLWLSIGSADRDSKVYRAHPEWFARDASGHHYSSHSNDSPFLTACFSTGWQGYIRDVLLDLVRSHGLEYLKLDFAIVSSPYQYEAAKAGCYATDHPGHRDHAESLAVNFDRMWEVFDAVHAAHPEVFIDCTFEAMGGLQLIDYAMLQHAEGNWLSNFEEPNAADDLRIRNMAWWRAPAMPATALVIGNARLNDPGYALHLKSLAGALPILLGDPRALSPDALRQCRAFADWLAAMARRHDIFSFRQDLPGFDEPQRGGWDGFQRINTDTRSGGIVGLFRHDAVEDSRRVTIAGLDPDALYRVRGMDGAPVAAMRGGALRDHGFDAHLPNRIDGTLLEVVRAGV